MVNKQLVDYIKSEEAQGYSSQQLQSYLVQQGYNPNEVRKAMDYANKPQVSKSTNKKFIFIGIALIIVIAVVAVSFLFLTKPICNNSLECDDNNVNTLDICINPSERISKCLNARQTQLTDVEKEITINLQDSISFKVNDEDHLIEVEEVTDNSVTLTIYSEPKKITLNIGQSKEIDIDNDGLNDLYVKLVRISNGKPIFEIKSLEKSSKLILGITSSKNTYQMAEPVSGEFKIDYSGKSFNGIVLYTYSKDGFDKKYYAKMRGSISSSNINMMKVAFKSFRLDEHDYSASTDYFYNEGNYHYTISVYSCETVSSTLNKDCSKIKEEELTNVKPLKTVTKTIKVQGGISPSECRVSEDCTKTCAGCEDGTQICEQSDEKCMDCFMDTQCKSGYKCRDNSCVTWECDENIDCNDNDASTKDTCNNFKCTHSKITHCIDNDLYCPDDCDANTDNDCTDKCESQIIDCGSFVLSEETIGNTPNHDCFIDASEDCCSAKLVTETEMNLFGMLIYSRSYREIKGLENERCVLYQRTDDISYSYADEIRQQMLDSGMTEEQIGQQLAQQNQQAQEMIIGKDSTCRYPINDLVNILEEEKQGSFSGSTEDVEKYQCTGSMYE